MTFHLEEQKIVRASCATAFEVVKDVQHYDQFIPWCQKSVVIEETGAGMIADLTIGFGPLQETYRSKVTFTPPTEIAVSALPGGPLKFLTTTWCFQGMGDDQDDAPRTQITLSLEGSFTSKLLEMTLKGVFAKSTAEILRAFQHKIEQP